MMSSKVKPEVNNAKIFKKIVRDYNEKTGYNFVLPKDTDYTSQYAHPVHDDGVIKINSQISPNHAEIYALSIKIDSVTVRTDRISYEELKKAMITDAFKYRLGVLKQLHELKVEISDRINNMEYELLDEVVKDIEKEENYDLAVRAARALYKEKL